MGFGRVLITGGAAGIGLSMARELLQNGAKRVCIGDKNRKKAKKAMEELECEFGKYKIMFKKCDVTIKTELKELFSFADTCFNGLDVVINNAGILDDLHWEQEIKTNLTAVFQGSFLAMEYMGLNNGRGGGTLVNISSINAMGCSPSVPVYTGTEHAILGFSRSLAMPFNYCRSGVRVLTVCPGVTQTRMIADAHTFTRSLEVTNEIRREINSLPSQLPICVAKGLKFVLTAAQNGSVWVAEGCKPIYEVEIPDRLTLRKCKKEEKVKI